MTISLKNYENGGWELWYGNQQIGGLRDKGNDTYDLFIIGKHTPTELHGSLKDVINDALSIYQTGKRISER